MILRPRSRSRSLLIIPFDDVIEDFHYMNQLLWFMDNGIKDVIELVVESIDTYDNCPVATLDFHMNYLDLYGCTLGDTLSELLLNSLDTLDRHKATPPGIKEDVSLINMSSSYLLDALELKFTRLFDKDDPWMPDVEVSKRWLNNKLIVPIKGSN